MTASTASNTRYTSGARRLIGRRAIVALAIGASATLGLSACGAGQVSQTATQVAGVSGGKGVSANGAVSVLDVKLVYPSREAAGEQSDLQISFVAVNSDPVNPDTLESITVNGQELELGDGDFTIVPNGAIGTAMPDSSAGGETDETASSAEATGTAAPTTTESAEATSTAPATEAPQSGIPKAATTDGVPVRVSVDPIDNVEVGAVGESVPVIFTFANAGDIELPTPLTLGPDVPRFDRATEDDAQD